MAAPGRPGQRNRISLCRYDAEMVRHLFTAASVLSLLLCVGTFALWVRSYWRYDDLRFTQLSTSSSGVQSMISMSVATNQGVLTLLNSKYVMIGQQLKQIRALLRQHVQAIRSWDHYSAPSMTNTFVDADQKFGFSWHRLSTEWEFICPMWFPTAIFSMLPLARIAPFVQKRMRIKCGHCSRCGYNLRASIERCSECGTPIPGQTGV